VRDDRGVAAGFEIPVFYDSLIAKLVVWGESRPVAIQRLRRALDEYRVIGVSTTLPFFRWLVDQREFADAAFSTTYLDTVLAARRGHPFCEVGVGDQQDAAVAAAIAAWSRGHRALAGPAADDRSAWRKAARLDGLR
jgi:acetyl/propionyl-CoA carboxylase alpha subunit